MTESNKNEQLVYDYFIDFSANFIAPPNGIFKKFNVENSFILENEILTVGQIMGNAMHKIWQNLGADPLKAKFPSLKEASLWVKLLPNQQFLLEKCLQIIKNILNNKNYIKYFDHYIYKTAYVEKTIYSFNGNDELEILRLDRLVQNTENFYTIIDYKIDNDAKNNDNYAQQLKKYKNILTKVLENNNLNNFNIELLSFRGEEAVYVI